jgi:hypothetical protein
MPDKENMSMLISTGNSDGILQYLITPCRKKSRRVLLSRFCSQFYLYKNFLKTKYLKVFYEIISTIDSGEMNF